MLMSDKQLEYRCYIPTNRTQVTPRLWQCSSVLAIHASAESLFFSLH